MVTQAVFGALNDPTRRSIVALLARSRLSVSQIASHFEVSRPAISRHLRVLREAEVVSETRSGRERLYRLEPDALDQAARWLASIAAGRGFQIDDPSADLPVAAEEAPGADAASGSDSAPEAPGATTDWRQW